jgi:hypothetical protein
MRLDGPPEQVWMLCPSGNQTQTRLSSFGPVSIPTELHQLNMQRYVLEKITYRDKTELEFAILIDDKIDH